MRRLLLVILLAGAAGLALAAAAVTPKTETDGMRTWTSVSGAKMKAAFVDLRRGRVILKTEDGGSTQIGLARLSDADKAWVQAEYRKRTGVAAVEEKPKAPDLSLLRQHAFPRWHGQSGPDQRPCLRVARDQFPITRSEACVLAALDLRGE